jgi:predicted nucleic acid-binding protein
MATEVVRGAGSKELARLIAAFESGKEVVIRKGGEEVARISSKKQNSLRSFLDTNVLLYADDSKDLRKQRIAVELILEHRSQRTGVVSVQVLQEYFVNATNKLKLDLDVARYKVEFHSKFTVAEPNASDVVAAIDIHRIHRLSFWDSLILRMAKQTGCRVLLSEDMQHGREFDGVKIVNPFL